MSKFDLVFEHFSAFLREKEFFASTFDDNLRLLVKILQSSDKLNKNIDIADYIVQLNKQPQNTKQILLDTAEKSLPAMKLHVKQDADPESFAITVINLENPIEQKTFKNSMLETIFDDVTNYIQTIALKGLSPDNAVQSLPPETDQSSQPGAEQSALPKVMQ